jgi:hypothetical protein
MIAPSNPTIPGWSSITDYVSARAPVSVSIDSVMRWAKRRHDPLPVKRWGPRDRPRVYCLVSDLDAWLDRQHRDAGEGT